MDKNKKLNQYTLEELHMQQKKLKSVIIGLGIVMLLACIILIYLAFKNDNYALIVVAVGSSITLLPSFIALKQIDTEIKSRNSKIIPLF